MIYFLQPEEGGPIKIGTAIRLSERLRTLCSETGLRLRVLAIVDGGRDEEQALHRRFHRLREVGEWFEPGDDLLGFIVAEGREWTPDDDAPPRRFSAMVRVEDRLGEQLRKVAALKGVSVAEYVSDALAPIVKRDMAKEVQKLTEEGEG